MSIDYRAALNEMRIRRTGLAYTPDSITERYITRATQPATQYTLGAMQEVSPDYTRVSVEEGERIANHVKSSLPRSITVRAQGSVPLNTHIRRASDVDMLVINERFFNYSETGALAGIYKTYPNIDMSAVQDMSNFRKECEDTLTTRYYAANVDTSGAKSIQISGGSVVRKVDIVPANWYRGNDYQRTESEIDKEIQIFNKYTYERPRNHPFKFIDQVNIKDRATQGGMKKAVRLLKNLKNDSPQNIDLSSYDITSVIWNMPTEKLNISGVHDLSILGNTQDYLEYLVLRPDFTKSLNTPDLSRKAIDTDEKMLALRQLSQEVTTLARKVYEEARVGAAITLSAPPSLNDIRDWLNEQHLAI